MKDERRKGGRQGGREGGETGDEDQTGDRNREKAPEVAAPNVCKPVWYLEHKAPTQLKPAWNAA